MTDYTTEAGFQAALIRARARQAEELREAAQALADAEAAQRAKDDADFAWRMSLAD